MYAAYKYTYVFVVVHEVSVVAVVVVVGVVVAVPKLTWKPLVADLLKICHRRT